MGLGDARVQQESNQNQKIIIIVWLYPLFSLFQWVVSPIINKYNDNQEIVKIIFEIVK